MVQHELAASRVLQELVCENADGSAPVIEIPEMDTAEAQLLARVKSWAAEVPPCGLLKESSGGRRVTQGGEPAAVPRS